MATPEAPGGVLNRILARTRERVRRRREERGIAELEKDAFYGRRPRDFRRAFLDSGPRVIAEIKFASPSRGRIFPGEPSAAQAVRVAEQYLSGGAAALSVLTEPEFFMGDVEYLRAIRRAQPEAPLLMKDFVVDVYQIHLARWAGADAVLLIVAALGRRLSGLLESAQALGLSALVEVHTEEEMAAARKAGAVLIGVNCRDLKTLKTDLGVARRLASTYGSALPLKGKAAVGPQPVLIAESGMSRRAELDELAAAGYRGFLVGTTLMETGRPGFALRKLLSPTSRKGE